VRHVSWILALAVLSLLVPAAPGYDAWAWLTWGRELGTFSLETAGGPAWKPLPVAVTTLLAPFGSWAPELWLIVARSGAIAALAMAFVVARRLGGTAAGAVAVAGVALTAGFVRHAAVGDTEPVLIALALGAFERALAGRHRQALLLGGLAALVRPEVWPFLAAYGVARWRAAEERRVVVALTVLIPAAWVLPELLSSGELFRSAERARIPNPGQPATADFPFLATLGAAGGALFLPAALGAVGARGRSALPAIGGAAWIVLVALMSEGGFSGEPRYLLPGAALIAVSGAVGLARLASAPLPRVAFALAIAAVGVARVGDIADLGPRLAYQDALAADLDRAIAAAGGRDAILACGRPAVGRYRGTLLAWRLRVPKRVVLADGERGDITFRSRLTRGARPAPEARGPTIAANAHWRVVGSCAAAPNARAGR
jgi:hypothetical protein